HARALLTGNEDPNFINGSYHFPLSGAAQPGSPPTPANGSGDYHQPMGSDGAWIGLLTPPDDEPADTFELVLDLETAVPARTCRIPLARLAGQTFTRPLLDASWQDIVQFIAAGAGFPIGDELLTAVSDGAGYRLSLFRTTVAGSGFAGFDGD